MRYAQNSLVIIVLLYCSCGAQTAAAQTAGPALLLPGAVAETKSPVVKPDKPEPAPNEEKTAALRAFKSQYNTPRVDEKKAIRAAWEEVFHTNVWAPYDKAKEIEDKVSEKASVKVFKLKGKPEHSDEGLRYIFKVKF